MKNLLLVPGVFLIGVSCLNAAEPVVTDAMKDANGFLVHGVESEFQKGPTPFRVLLPDPLDAKKRYPVVYVLPVEAKNENRYGDGLLEVKKHGLHQKHQAIFVAPSFALLPWYADHPTDLVIRQESYLVRVVCPYVEKQYPAIPESHGRLLLGFSKSGWGAWSILLRHPDRFGKAVAWDAPMMMEKPGMYGSGPIFGSAENFAKYQITKLLKNQPAEFSTRKRLILLGMGNFRGEHEAMHALLNELKIPHEYTEGPRRQHDWHSGWVTEAVTRLLNGEAK